MTATAKILVVEDDEGVAVLQQRRLERVGYTVVTAGSCEEALSRAKAGVDVVVLDYWLGNTTGLEVCQQLRAADLDLPVVMVTGSSEESTVVQALRSGVRDFVHKSSNYLDDLPQAVERVLRQKRAELQLDESEAQRRHGQKMEALGHLAGGVAHEFNNLLQVIQGFTESALGECGDRPEVCEDLEEVLDAASRAAILTGQLLTFGRRQSVQMEAVDLQCLITDLLKMLRPLLGQEIAIDFQIDPHIGRIWASETMIGQAIMNLCLNARDAMPGGGQLAILCRNFTVAQSPEDVSGTLVPGQYVRLQISDTGTGIAPEHISHLYEPFFTTKPIGKGTGLGLATVFGVIKEHAGTISVQSTVGKGTIFEIYLPLTAAGPSVRAADLTNAGGGGETILLAEDEAGVRHHLERVLRRAGYQVLTAGDGEEALDIFRRHRDSISLLLLDMVMPKMSGRDTFEAIRALRPELRAAFITGYDPDFREPRTEGPERFRVLRKPLRQQELLQTVRELLDNDSASGRPALQLAH